MKRTACYCVFLFSAILFMFSSCTNDDDSPKNEKTTANLLFGAWSWERTIYPDEEPEASDGEILIFRNSACENKKYQYEGYEFDEGSIMPYYWKINDLSLNSSDLFEPDTRYYATPYIKQKENKTSLYGETISFITNK